MGRTVKLREILQTSEFAHEFTEKLVKVVKKARVGNPLDPETHIGPIANRIHYETILEKIKDAVNSGHTLILDGRTSCKENGYYFGPTIFF